jgi:CMP/dCMP kinase
MTLPTTITIDGPAASGKSTLGALLADELGYLYFDTGVMYRAVTLAAIQHGLDVSDEAAIAILAQNVRIDVRPPTVEDGRDIDVLLESEDVTREIRSELVNENVSQVSAYADVREAMTAQQRRIAYENKIVMVGRDIGTVVLPDADLKIYLDASVDVRARRRYKEMVEQNKAVNFAHVLQSLKSRDKIDSNRDIAPLRPADDAVVIHADNLSIQQVLDQAKELVYNV